MTDLPLSTTLTQAQIEEAIFDWVYKNGFSTLGAKITLHRTAGQIDPRDGVHKADTYGAIVEGIKFLSGLDRMNSKD